MDWKIDKDNPSLYLLAVRGAMVIYSEIRDKEGTSTLLACIFSTFKTNW